ncbi:MAG: HIT domain-containing protein [Gemmatimonadetes bacterium]|nr:HIT domain-containing protein [Gemmatimonadota bacterium]
MTGCLFCGIARGEIKASIVTQDNAFVSFRDINPQAPTHILVIPRKHVATLNEATDAGLLGKLLVHARDVARGEGLADRGYRLVINTNAEGRAMAWPPG